MTLSDSPHELNDLVTALPPTDRAVLLRRARMVFVESGEIVRHAASPLRAVYFPLTCVISWMNVMRDGHHAEVATVGNEGMLGVDLIVRNVEKALGRATCQISGGALKLSAKTFSVLLNDHPGLRHLTVQYSHALLVQVIQSAGCNSLHSAQQRYARCLLTMQDRARSSQFPFTHELVATMLAVRRQTITTVSGRFQRQGLIDQRRGRLKILDRRGLEQVTCECYERVRHVLNRARRMRR